VCVIGGDAGRVTVMGQSSGGSSVFALLASAASRGLLHAAISLSGSPNISMDLGTAYAQNRPFVSSTNCTGARVAACLLALPAEAVLAATPSGWDYVPFVFPFPMSRSGGTHYPGLLIVDGRTVQRPFIDALAQGLVDVPLIVQSENNELELMVDTTNVSALSRSAFEQMFADYLTPGFGNASAEVIFTAYASLLASNVSNNFILQQMSADWGLACAGPTLARYVAGLHRRASPVYLSLVTAGPVRPYPCVMTAQPLSDPFHLWDYMAGARDWTLVCAEPCTWTPTAADVALGDHIRQMWIDLAYNATLSDSDSAGCLSSSRRVRPPFNWCLPQASGVSTRFGFRDTECEAWSSIGFDSREWWSS
jgi:carboxylesterase type B